VKIEIEDDGRGVLWDEIRVRAGARGERASTREDLSAALFLDGVSTAREVTAMSGRGVGMGAIRSTVRTLGGDLKLGSEPGRGTLLRMRFPEPAVALAQVAGLPIPAGGRAMAEPPSTTQR